MSLSQQFLLAWWDPLQPHLLEGWVHCQALQESAHLWKGIAALINEQTQGQPVSGEPAFLLTSKPILPRVTVAPWWLSPDGTLELLEMLKNSQLWGSEILVGGSAVRLGLGSTLG